MKKLITTLTLGIMLTSMAQGQSYLAENHPDRVILNLTNDAAHTQAVNWRTNVIQGSGQIAQLRIENNTPEFADTSIRVFQAESNVFADRENNQSMYHNVSFDQLQPDRTYNYRVGKEGAWSEWFQFRTAAEVDSLSFIYLGDAQNDLRSRWTRVYRKAIQTCPEADFVLHAGDLINRSNSDNEWGEWFYAGTGINSSYPQLMVPGNHEYFRDEQKVLTLDPHWQHQFRLPENGAAGLEESNYFVDYGPLRIIALNTQVIMLDSTYRAAQAQWLEEVLKNNPSKWTVVMCHHPVYSTAKSRDNYQFSDLFRPLFEKYGVHLLLQGHDHTYARSVLPSKKEKKPVYIVSVAGPKMYQIDTQKEWIQKSAENTQLFQVIDIKGNTLYYKAYTADGILYDDFELHR
ncbi:metallophosphoesterase family protein [Sphingobacterium alkalisoli]|uniref:Metallophosphoesterase family protein n=1 Tax=Sphingobacterium alkalisoli TaxID=1874115 RepID=A0A4U0H5N1_9SPHI|nr:metallophosphoesterase family protein [Sphingobacterium alkalisoli]TJY67067.1 metallophosphoesterase family protein [Sphingobacterium alkalisoli]GGH12438.1 phosphoesterase [Sphingobacterium alkalisoli]